MANRRLNGMGLRHGFMALEEARRGLDSMGSFFELFNFKMALAR